MAFATPSALLAAALLAPTVVVSIFDAQPKRPVTRVVFIAGAGFAFGPIWHLNANDPSMSAALDMLSDPRVLCPAWLAGACGWAICELLPLTLRLAAEKNAGARVAALVAEAAQIREEWDLN